MTLTTYTVALQGNKSLTEGLVSVCFIGLTAFSTVFQLQNGKWVTLIMFLGLINSINILLATSPLGIHVENFFPTWRTTWGQNSLTWRLKKRVDNSAPLYNGSPLMTISIPPTPTPWECFILFSLPITATPSIVAVLRIYLLSTAINRTRTLLVTCDTPRAGNQCLQLLREVSFSHLWWDTVNNNAL